MGRRRETKPSGAEEARNRPSRPDALLLFLASALFLTSGATGLAYEVIWFKRFTHVWGSSSTAIAAVVASFLFGLGIGAYLLGKLADRVSTPLRWYGICELGVGLFALVAQAEIDALARATAAIESLLPTWPGLAFGLRFLITLFIIGPPCILMGGTLPLLVRQFTPAKSALSAATGWLYAVNTLGAGAGSYLTGFHLLPALGLPATNRAAAIANLAIGLASMALAGKLAPVRRPESRGAVGSKAAVRPAPAPEPAPAVPDGAGGSRVRLGWSRVHVAAALTGAAALILQITWNRQLAVVLGGSTYAFTATLFVVLIAIAAGSLLFHAAFRKGTSRARAPEPSPEGRGPGRLVAAATALFVAAAAVASKWAIPWLSDQVGSIALAHLRASAAWNAAISVGASATVELLPSLGMGFLFPLLVALTRSTGAEAGRAIGGIYVWNTAGTLAGAILTAILVFPLGGTALATAIAVGLYVLTALLLWPRARAAVVTAGLGLALVFLAIHPIDPRATDMGAYLYGPLTPEARAHTRVHFFREGASSNVLVTDEGTSRNLRVNGKIDATTGNDMATQLGLAYLPRAFHPQARDVAIIGFGSGTTAGASLLFPDTRVVCCEIEPAVYATSALFSAANHGVETHPGLTMFFGDGRSYLQGTRDTFDLIISEPSNPWLAGVSNLFTQEFFATVEARLRPGGILAQWIQTYAFSIAEYALIVRTLRTVFPHYGLISLGEGQDTILLASTAPLAPDAKAMAELAAVIAASPGIRRDLTAHFGTDDMRQILLTSHVLDEAGLERLIAADRASTLNTDANVRLEFDAPLHLFETSEVARIEIARRIIAATDRAWVDERATALGLAPGSPARALARGRLDRRQGRLPVAIAELTAAIGGDPPLAGAYRELGGAHLAAGDTAAALRAYAEWTTRLPEDAEAHATLGGFLSLIGRVRNAVPSFETALELDPDLASSANNLAWIRATHQDPALRNGTEAVRLAERACELTGFQQPDCLDTLAAAHAENGDFAAAERLARQALATRLTGRVARAEVERRLALYERREPYRDR